MKNYVVRIPCEVAGHWRVPGVPFALTDAQARPISPPHGGVVYPIEDARPVAVVAPVVEAPAAIPDVKEDRAPAREKRRGRQRRT